MVFFYVSCHFFFIVLDFCVLLVIYLSDCLTQVYFESDEVHACIVTCGGLCPGLNTVIRELVCGLYHMYGVHRIIGIEVFNFNCLFSI